jgi:diguanylate cyclase (GGDEF)-like protein/PAS domain S-box-containing protein
MVKNAPGCFVRWVKFDLTRWIANGDRLIAMTKKITYASFRSRLIAGFLLLVALLAALLFWKITSAYNAERAAAFSQTKSFTQAMSAHVASEMRSVDLSLIRSAEALGALDVAALANVSRVRQVLALSASVSDAHFWINFVDNRGFGVAASNNLRIAGVSYADRSYFKASATRCDSGLFIGGPEIGRKSKRHLFYLSRAVCSPTGAPLGVVVAPVDARALAEVFGSALFNPTLSITLLHGEGKIVARAPLFERSFSRDITGSDLYRNWKGAPFGSYEGRSAVDRKRRVFSYQTVSALPLAVAVGVGTGSWLDALGKDGPVALGAFAVIVVILASSGSFALRSFKRVERSDANQRELNVELREAQENMERAAKRARMIADSLPAWISYVDADERYVFHNSYYKNVPGVDVENMLGRTMREVLGDQTYLAISEQVKAVLGGAHVIFERAIHASASERHLKYDYTPDVDGDGGVIGFYAMVIDITESKLVEARLSALARVDNLTGLPNRNHLYERLGEALARSRRGGFPTACLYLDIDHFKSINDSLGHAGGDEVLRQFGKRLNSCVRNTDLVARLAGDEFVIVVEGLVQPQAALAVAGKIVETMRAPFVVEDGDRAVSTSVGIAISDGKNDDADAILRNADAALYRAKRAGRGGFETSASDNPKLPGA